MLSRGQLAAERLVRNICCGLFLLLAATLFCRKALAHYLPLDSIISHAAVLFTLMGWPLFVCTIKSYLDIRLPWEKAPKEHNPGLVPAAIAIYLYIEKWRTVLQKHCRTMENDIGTTGNAADKDYLSLGMKVTLDIIAPGLEQSKAELGALLAACETLTDGEKEVVLDGYFGAFNKEVFEAWEKNLANLGAMQAWLCQEQAESKYEDKMTGCDGKVDEEGRTKKPTVDGASLM